MKQHTSPDSHASTASQAPAAPASRALMPLQAAQLSPGGLTPTQMMQLQRAVGNRAVLQLMKSPNRTGLPDRLKAGVEQLSNVAMDDVTVHYNASEPAQLQAAAYTQGTDIYVGPGQERHLPHEAWHVVQQKQGRVRPNAQGSADAAPIQFAAPGPIEHALNSCYVAAIINTFTVVQSLKRLLIPALNPLDGAAVDLQNLLLRAVNTVDATQPVSQVWVENIMLSFVSNGIIDNVADAEDVNLTMGRLIDVLAAADAAAGQDNHMPVSSGIVVWDDGQTVSEALDVSLTQQGIEDTPPNTVHINRQIANAQAAPQQFTYGADGAAVQYRLRSVIYRDQENFGADHFVSYVDRGAGGQEWYESEDVEAAVRPIADMTAIGPAADDEEQAVVDKPKAKEPKAKETDASGKKKAASKPSPSKVEVDDEEEVDDEQPQGNMLTSAVAYIYERDTIAAPAQHAPPVVAPLGDQAERSDDYLRNLVGLGSSLAMKLQKMLLSKYQNAKDLKGIASPVKDLEASQTLGGMLENESEASSKMSDLLATGITLDNIRTLVSRTVVGTATLLKNIQESDPGFIREVLVALDYINRWGADNVLIQFGSAQLKDIKAILRNHKFNDTAEALNTASPEDFLNREEDHEFGLPVGADIVVWVKDLEVGKNTFIQSKNISGGGGDWKAKIQEYVSYAAGQLAGYNLQEFSIADKDQDAFEGIALLTYDASEDLLAPKNQDQLVARIKEGLKRLHKFDFLKSDSMKDAARTFIGRQMKYTSKVIVRVPGSKQEQNTLVFDVRTQAQSDAEVYSSDISSLKINSSLSRALEHNELTDEELEQAELARNVEEQFTDHIASLLFGVCQDAIYGRRDYGEVFEEHFLAGIGAYGVDAFVSRFTRYALLAYMKQTTTKERGKSQKVSVEETTLDELLELYSAEYKQGRDPDAEQATTKKGGGASGKKKAPAKKGNTKKGGGKKGGGKKGGDTAPPTPSEQIHERLNDLGNPTPADYEEIIPDGDFMSIADAINWKELMRAMGVSIVGLTDVD